MMSTKFMLSSTMRPSPSRKKTLSGSRPQYFAACLPRLSTFSFRLTRNLASLEPAPSPLMWRLKPVVSVPVRKCTSTIICSSSSLGRRRRNRSMVSLVTLWIRIFWSVSRVTFCCSLNSSSCCFSCVNSSLQSLSLFWSSNMSNCSFWSSLFNSTSSFFIFLCSSCRCSDFVILSRGFPVSSKPSTHSLTLSDSILSSQG
mmetsp:Transcript_62533/g.146660  ORF Transcript_62533/g.146660 Transcript_62533/m.146660 type:complete len:200 (+) Transcript_62533:2174-2773(+)